MSFEFRETTATPPFFDKDKWTLDPAKIVTRTPKQPLSSIPGEENVIVPVQTAVISVKKHIRFAPYDICYKRINGQDFIYKMEPAYNTRARLELLEDEVFILRLNNEKLTRALERKNKQITKLETINDILFSIPLFVLLIAYWVTCKYFSAK